MIQGIHATLHRLSTGDPILRPAERSTHLERGLSVLDEHLEVSLVPGTSLRSRLERIVLSAVRVVAGSAGVGSTIGLATGLDPDEGINEGISSGASGADTETGAVDVAPVTPRLAEASDGVAAGIDDGLAGHAGALELGAEERHVELLVLGLVILSISGCGELSGGQVVCVPSGDVGGDTTNLLGGAGRLVHIGETLGTGLCGVVRERSWWTKAESTY
jgi:hypothetical protein